MCERGQWTALSLFSERLLQEIVSDILISAYILLRRWFCSAMSFISVIKDASITRQGFAVQKPAARIYAIVRDGTPRLRAHNQNITVTASMMA
jgi:hypothetical protein